MKRTYIFGGIGVIALLFVSMLNYQNKMALKEYKYTYETMGKLVNVVLYTNNQKKADSVYEDVKNTYTYYAEIGDYSAHHDGMTNLYDIKNSESSDQYINISSDLASMIKIGLEWSTKSNCTISVIDACSNPSVDIIKDNTILNTHLNINLDKMLMGYASEKATSMIKSAGVTTYSLSYDDSYVLGNYYTFGKYNIGLKNDDNSDVFKTVKLVNNSVSTYKSNVDGIKSVTVISPDATYSYMLGYILSYKTVDEGKELLKGINSDAIWYTNDDQIIKTDGVSDYE
jgi:thiamine biosynthesis lipoprotein ApbE